MALFGTLQKTYNEGKLIIFHKIKTNSNYTFWTAS